MSLIWERMGELALASRTSTYLGDTPDGLSVYAMAGWDAWLAMWSLVGEWRAIV